MIPRIIHQIWVGPRQPPTQLIATWHQMAAEFGWEHKLWRDPDIETFGLQNKAIYDVEDWTATKSCSDTAACTWTAISSGNPAWTSLKP
jgi:hypothetical protein